LSFGWHRPWVSVTIRREYARAVKGQLVLSDIPGKRTTRTSIIAGLNIRNPLAPMYFEGYCNTDLVMTWLKAFLIPELEPGQKVVWDNASFHQSPELQELIEAAGCELIYLPAYSPDFNPIEQWWAKLKALIRRLKKHTMTLQQALVQAFQAMSNKLLN
jgi:transposase